MNVLPTVLLALAVIGTCCWAKPAPQELAPVPEMPPSMLANAANVDRKESTVTVANEVNQTTVTVTAAADGRTEGPVVVAAAAGSTSTGSALLDSAPATSEPATSPPAPVTDRTESTATELSTAKALPVTALEPQAAATVPEAVGDASQSVLPEADSNTEDPSDVTGSSDTVDAVPAETTEKQEELPTGEPAANAPVIMTDDLNALLPEVAESKVAAPATPVPVGTVVTEATRDSTTASTTTTAAVDAPTATEAVVVTSVAANQTVATSTPDLAVPLTNSTPTSTSTVTTTTTTTTSSTTTTASTLAELGNTSSDNDDSGSDSAEN